VDDDDDATVVVCRHRQDWIEESKKKIQFLAAIL
jgi:hypothetical protein